MQPQTIENIFVRAGYCTSEEMEEIKEKASVQGQNLGEFLLASGKIDEEEFLPLYADFFQIPFLASLPEQAVNSALVRTFTIQYLKRHCAVPVMAENKEIQIVTSNPATLDIINDFCFVLGEEKAVPVLAPQAAVLKAINAVFGNVDENFAADEVLEDLPENSLGSLEDELVEDLLDDTNEAPFIKLVNMILSQAVRAMASDIHIEPYQDSVRVRFRLDGILYDKFSVPKRYHAPLISRIKIMAKLNIAERRLPQDGRITRAYGGRQVDLRVSSIPTAHGERVVMRLLEKTARIMSIEELGLSKSAFTLFQNITNVSHGIILVTGPTGAGKTTTLYAILNQLNSPDKNILTIEDPVEYQLDGIGQLQVNPKIGLSFASGLRAMLRQDPDVILVGEIRDRETADIAVQAALTGHLVFSTLHTNDAPSAITRLIDMGIEPFLLSSVLRGIVAQRLLRVLCPQCKADSPSQEARITADFKEFSSLYTGETVYKPVGCKECMQTGYRGRTALYEIMEVTDSLAPVILSTSDANEIRKKAKEYGMCTLRQDGFNKVLQGITNFSEVLRTINL